MHKKRPNKIWPFFVDRNQLIFNLFFCYVLNFKIEFPSTSINIECVNIDDYEEDLSLPTILVGWSNIKKIYPHINISVDGSVNKMTAKKIVDAGATRLIVGSAIFNGQAEENIKEMREIVR